MTNITQYVLGEEITARFKKMTDEIWAVQHMKPLPNKVWATVIDFICCSDKVLQTYFDPFYHKFVLSSVIFASKSYNKGWTEWIRVKSNVFEHQIYDESLIKKLQVLLGLE